jgi:hypothetical protein
MQETPDNAEYRKLKQGTVGEQLDSVTLGLLPGDIQNDPNVRWVLSCSDSDLPDDYEYDPRSGSAHFAYRAAWQMISSLLKDRLPFYSATLFHIGRQWRISERLAKEARRLQDASNLAASEQNVISFAKQGGRDLDQKLARESIIAISNAAATQHDRSLEQAKTWWNIWSSEVNDLRKVVLAFKEQVPPRDRDIDRDRGQPQAWLTTFATFLFVQQRPSRTRYALRDGGVIFRNDVDFWPPTAAALTALLPAVFGFTALSSGYDRHGYREWSDLLRFLRYEIRDIQNEPKIKAGETRLRERYGNQNPFDEFAIGKKAASERLRALLKENEFVDEEISEWREAWEATLESAETFDQRPPAAEALAPARIDRAIRSVDSTIKKEIENTEGPIETFAEFCQRIFEQEWIKPVGHSLFKKSNADALNVWTLADFEALLAQIVSGLKAIGYELSVPKSSRLTTLQESAIRGDNYWDLEW